MPRSSWRLDLQKKRNWFNECSQWIIIGWLFGGIFRLKKLLILIHHHYRYDHDLLWSCAIYPQSGPRWAGDSPSSPKARLRLHPGLVTRQTRGHVHTYRLFIEFPWGGRQCTLKKSTRARQDRCFDNDSENEQKQNILFFWHCSHLNDPYAVPPAGGLCAHYGLGNSINTLDQSDAWCRTLSNCCVDLCSVSCFIAGMSSGHRFIVFRDNVSAPPRKGSLHSCQMIQQMSPSFTDFSPGLRDLSNVCNFVFFLLSILQNID